MGEERLNGIAHTSINSDTALEYSSDWRVQSPPLVRLIWFDQ